MTRRRQSITLPAPREPLRGPDEVGFTLIELSIVLVIIGLVVGRVVTGHHLIRAAEVQATLTQIQKYDTAANTFRAMCEGLPGDVSAQGANACGLKPRGQYAGEGDGNGVIEGISSNASGQNSGTQESTGETATFWVDLSTLGLIDGGFNTASESNVPVADITAATTPNISAYLPQAKLGQGNYIYVYSFQNINLFGLSAVSSIGGQSGDDFYSNQTGAGSLTVQEAWAIDKKIDDGMPLTGKVLAQYVNCCGSDSRWLQGSNAINYSGQGGAASLAQSVRSDSCYDNGGSASNPTQYSMEQNNGAGLNCELSFVMQGAAR